MRDNPLDENLFRKTNRNLIDFLFETSTCSADTIAFRFYHRKYTYGALRERVYDIAGRLCEMGIGKADRILISLITTPDSIALVYACNLIGATPILADVRLSASELYSLICDTEVETAFISDFNLSNPRLLLSPPKLKRLIVASPCDTLPIYVRMIRKLHVLFIGNPYILFLAKSRKLYLWNSLFGKAKKKSFDPRLASKNGGELIFTTSGTTGSRKYVRISAFSLNLAAYRFSLCMDLSEIRTVLSVMPIFTCYGFLNSVHAPLAFQKELILYPIYRFNRFPGILHHAKASASFGVLGQWESMLHSRSVRNADLSYLRFASWGGDGCSEERLNAINQFLSAHRSTAKLLQGYGMTETVSAATLQTPDDYVIGSAGKPLPYVRICITESGTDHVLPAGQIGEICIHSICQTIGYDRDPIASKRLLHMHDDGLIWVHSGDLGYLDQDNHLFVVGRIKRMYVTENGTKVFLPRLEETARKNRKVSDCAAIYIRKPEQKEKGTLILSIVPNTGKHSKRLKREMYEMLRRELPSYLLPDQIVFLKQIPKNALGKPDYPELTAIWGYRAV